MKCINCGGPAVESPWGTWCDPCGGVHFKPGLLFFRHVATVDGTKGRHTIVFDISTGDYAYASDAPNPNADKVTEDGFKRPRTQTFHGSLDAMIAVSFPYVADLNGPAPELSAAPSATPEEMDLILRAL